MMYFIVGHKQKELVYRNQRLHVLVSKIRIKLRSEFTIFSARTL